MSGGSYDYVSHQINEAASTLRARHAKEAHVVALAALLDRIATVMHDIEWADSSDTSWTPELDAAIRALLQPGAELDVAIAQGEEVQRVLGYALHAARARTS